VRRWILACAAVLLLSTLVSAQLFGGKKPEDTSSPRNLSGLVLDRADHPVPNAIVYIKNLRTLAIVTFIVSENGEYRFNSLSPSVDYEIHAESSGHKSAPRTLSSFDSRKQAKINLKIDK
jgi:Carboxypeptidase regulatory-like domain